METRTREEGQEASVSTLDPATESVLDEARALRQQLSMMLVWVSMNRKDPKAFAESLRSVGYALRFTGDDLIDHAHKLDAARKAATR
jgi:hypothetical protein